MLGLLSTLSLSLSSLYDRTHRPLFGNAHCVTGAVLNPVYITSWVKTAPVTQCTSYEGSDMILAGMIDKALVVI